MLAIRMQRTGRKGHAQFRLIVQDSRCSPKSGNIVHLLGSYDPHSKQVSLNKEKAEFYLKHGAQPSSRAALLLKSEGVKLPKWVIQEGKKQADIKNIEKLRRNRSADAEAVADKPAEAEATESKPAESEAIEPAESIEAKTKDEGTAETTTEEVKAKVPVEEQASDKEPAAETEPKE